MHEEYFRRRLLQELKRAEECSDPGERAIHLQACRHYRALLEFNCKGHGQHR